MKKQIILKKNESDYKLIYNDKEILIKNNVIDSLHIYEVLFKGKEINELDYEVIKDSESTELDEKNVRIYIDQLNTLITAICEEIRKSETSN
jgi:hypothetical protein